MRAEDVDIAGLPEDYTAARPRADDAAEVATLLAEHERRGKGSSSASEEGVLTTLTGIGSWTRRQALVRERSSSRIVAWLSVHDRAAGRTIVDLLVDPDLAAGAADELAAELFRAAERYARDIAAMRTLRWTVLDSGAYESDERQQRFLLEAGYEHVRTWLQMSRPVGAEEAHSMPGPREGVTVRRVEQHPDGLPVAQDLQAVHQVLEESFADHFSSYRESFPEFVMRLREDAGHRWDHWWLATVETDEGTLPAGALVSSVIGPDASGREGSYVDYIGVHRRARGRGVAKALLHTVIADAAERGRGRVGLEVDADSPTGADGLYASLGWETTYRTQSWHRNLAVDAPAQRGEPGPDGEPS
ncbi:GNAT family N-acetyltransferase [Nostocoides sp. F2B08]|uniref:GNAT family N-acetyltransferase n=1 Tax=Nostocoides sp. F2B08 TaxID=2653936 RepID=UPI00126398BE|nr:GNAT family N-acetyltransferase [Tetrasphaera sp. F2B08]KAB7743945.1 GNAT family N-acetyltransferase [Tetrasphaera sp. F2B08]